jgi:hypothetical protein
LIKLDKHAVGMADNDNVVPACTDKSQLHNNHSSGMSWYASQELMGKSPTEGKRLIALHAVMLNEPPCQRDPVTNVPCHDRLA